MTYEEIADTLGVTYPVPDSDWLPFSGRLPRIEIYVDGQRKMVLGGAHKCLFCGFGVDIIPSENTEPKARSDGKCPNCANTGKRLNR